MRAFIAVDLSEEIRAKIKEVQQQFAVPEIEARSGIKLKFVNPTQAHQTVKFLGDVPDKRGEELKRALATIRQEPFTIALRGVGFFPKASLEKARTIRVVWIGLEKGVKELKALQEEVESKMYALGFPYEKQFSAHVTICRVKTQVRSRAEIEPMLTKIAEMRDGDVGEMLLDTLKLKKSTLTPEGPIYEDVYVKRLTAQVIK